ncbi:MAG TPA: SDR family oxidoreductase [Smithella sp.]|nr:SDR family oxidoreductase [Smithella sp.]
MLIFSGKTALITGASSGLGAKFAKELAREGCNLVLAARREDRLRALKEELEGSYNIRVDVIPVDLSTINGCEKLISLIGQKRLSIDILINNAGFGYEGEFISQKIDRINDMIGLNITTLTVLSQYFGMMMAKKQWGYILLTSSVGAFAPCPQMAVYDATKAYVLLLGEALHNEFKQNNVVVTTLCPGAMETDFFNVSGQILNPLVKMTLMKPRDVAIKSLKGLSKGKSVVIPGLLNQLSVFSLRFLPRLFMAPIVKKIMS